MNDTLHPHENASKGQTPYSAWIQTDVLHSLQRTVSDHPGEHAWIVHVQVSELYWMLIIKEIQTAQACLRADNLAQAQRTLLRVVAHHAPLDAIWRSIAWMTPNDLLAILSRAAATHGKDTALQGWTYRHMAYLLGIKQAEHLQHFAPQPEGIKSNGSSIGRRNGFRHERGSGSTFAPQRITAHQRDGVPPTLLS